MEERQYKEIPSYGPFWGREKELERIISFLRDRDRKAKSIMIIAGQRGIGKSAIAREAASLSKDDFETIVWIHRTRFCDFLKTQKSHEPVIPTREETLDPQKILSKDFFEYRVLLQSKCKPLQDEDQETRDDLFLFFRDLLQRQPFLLIIDDFDEYEIGGGINSQICEQLHWITSPNKVILTARSGIDDFEHWIPEPLDLGLLGKDNVYQLVEYTVLEKINTQNIFGCDSNTFKEFIWKKTGGQPEIIMKFLVPTIFQTYTVQTSLRFYENSINNFASTYLTENDQPKNYRNYNKESYPFSIVKDIFTQMNPDEQFLFLSLVDCKNRNALSSKELAENLGYCLEYDEDRESFSNCLLSLYRKRLVGKYVDYQNEPKADDGKPAIHGITWILLPFIHSLSEQELLDKGLIEQKFRAEQIRHWIKYVHYYENDSSKIAIRLEFLASLVSVGITNKTYELSAELAEGILGPLLTSNLLNLYEHQRILLDTYKTAIDHVCQENKPDITTRFSFLICKLCLRVTEHLENATLWAPYTQYFIDQCASRVAKKDLTFPFEFSYLMLGISAMWGNALEIEKWLNIIKDHPAQITGDQGYVIFWVSNFFIRQHDWSHAEDWLKKLNNNAYSDNLLELFVKSYIWITSLYELEGKYEEALQWLKAAEEILATSALENREKFQIKNFISQSELYQKIGDDEKCRMSLQNAIVTAKSAKLSSLEEKLGHWLSYVNHRNSPFEPGKDVEPLLQGFIHSSNGTPIDLEYPVMIFASGEFCPLCKDKEKQIDFKCPSCGLKVHKKCIEDIHLTNCPICGSNFNMEEITNERT